MATVAPVPISSSPAAGQLVEYDGKTYDTIREGRAYILTPPNTRTVVDPATKTKAKAKTGEHSQSNSYISLLFKCPRVGHFNMADHVFLQVMPPKSRRMSFIIPSNNSIAT